MLFVAIMINYSFDRARIFTTGTVDVYSLLLLPTIVSIKATFSRINNNNNYGLAGWLLVGACYEEGWGDKTCFTTQLGTFRFTRIPFDMKNSPATFMWLMDKFRSTQKIV